MFFSETISRESKVGHCLLAPPPSPVYAVVFILGSQEKNIYLPSQIQWKNMTSFEVNLRGWISIIQNNYFLFSYVYIVNICIKLSKEVNYYLKYEGKIPVQGVPINMGLLYRLCSCGIILLMQSLSFLNGVYYFCTIKIDIKILRNLCIGESFCVEYHILKHKRLIWISNVETFKFEDQCLIHSFCLSLKNTSTTGYQRGVKGIESLPQTLIFWSLYLYNPMT